MRQLKTAIGKDELLTVVGYKERSFLDKIDSLVDVELSEGKWSKLYSLIAQARHQFGENIFIYESPNLHDYDTSCHKRYPHECWDTGRTPIALMVNPDPKVKRREKKPKIKTENWYLNDKVKQTCDKQLDAEACDGCCWFSSTLPYRAARQSIYCVLLDERKDLT
jgi:hypothetical protein